MATKKHIAPAAAHPSEDSGDRIRAYLAAVQVDADFPQLARDPRYRAGRALIERIAASAHDYEWPTERITPTECANVVYFIRNSEPVRPRTWFDNPADRPHHLIGLRMVLDTIDSSLRDCGASVSGTDAPGEPPSPALRELMRIIARAAMR